MKRLLSVMIICLALLATTALAGDNCGGCPSKVACGSAKAAVKAHDCGDCTLCDGAHCEWDMSHWKGLKYQEDGSLARDLTESQARKVAAQYLKKTGGEKCRVVSVEETPHCYSLRVQAKNSNEVQKLVITKQTAQVRKLDA